MKKILVVSFLSICVITNFAFAKNTKKVTAEKRFIRGIHLTSWIAGLKSRRAELDRQLDSKEINAVVIALKEYNGDVYVPGVAEAIKYNAYVRAVPDLKEYVNHLKSKGVYTIARLVLFKDNIVAKKEPSWAVKFTDGRIWQDHKGYRWLDPYNKKVWEYNFAIADKCVEYGFDEIQFDYVRFPSDGLISQCRYSVKHSSTSSINCINEFLKTAHKRYNDKGIKLSIDVFGLTTSADDDMGIGQIIGDMAKYVDYVCPMVYPSHYRNGTYNIKNPNSQPYRTINASLKKARVKMGQNAKKLRPYLQDFSLGYKYTAHEVREQIKAVYDNNIGEWILWSPKVTYTYSALKPKDNENFYEMTVSTKTA